jgi:hypothetical protein
MAGRDQLGALLLALLVWLVGWGLLLWLLLH